MADTELTAMAALTEKAVESDLDVKAQATAFRTFVPQAIAEIRELQAKLAAAEKFGTERNADCHRALEREGELLHELEQLKRP